MFKKLKNMLKNLIVKEEYITIQNNREKSQDELMRAMREIAEEIKNKKENKNI